MKSIKERTDYSVKWFMQLDDEKKEEAVRHLFEHAIMSEWVDVRSEEEAVELAADSNDSVEYYQAPYFPTCGEPLAQGL